MTEREAIRKIRKIKYYFGTDEDQKDIEHNRALNLAIAALEKQVAVRPLGCDNGGAEDYEEWAECPKCSESIPEYTLENETECYCLGCGQFLNWSEEE